MLSDTNLSVAGHTFSISNTSLLIAAAVILGVVVLLLAFSRGRQQVVAIRRSVTTDELFVQLGRIADSLERLANQRAERVIEERSQRVETPPQREETPMPPAPPTLNEEPHRVSYSMFGR